MKKGLFYFLITLIITTLIIINCDSEASSGDSSNEGGGDQNPLVTTAPEINIKNNTNDILNGTNNYSVGSTETGTPIDVVFTIENSGTGDLQLLTAPAIDLSGDAEYILLIDASTDIAKENSTTFTVRFNPSAAGTFTTEVTAANNDDDEGNYNFTITADAADPVVLEPEINIKENTADISSGTTGYSIGSTETGTPIDVIFTIENTGTDDLRLLTSPAIELSGDAEYTLLADASTTIAKEDSTTFTIRFDTSTAGTYTTEIIIANNDSDEGTYTFTITADASDPVVLQPDIDVEYLGSSVPSESGSKVDLGKVKKGTTEYFTFKIKNTGTSDLNLTGTPIVSITGSATFGINLTNTDTTISSGDETTFTISFSPVANAKVNIDVEIINNDPDALESPYIFEINGQGKN